MKKNQEIATLHIKRMSRTAEEDFWENTLTQPDGCADGCCRIYRFEKGPSVVESVWSRLHPLEVADGQEEERRDWGNAETGIDSASGQHSSVDGSNPSPTDLGGWMWRVGVFFDLQNSLLDSLDVADFVDAQLFQISPFQSEQLGAADVVPDKIIAILFQLERLQPDGHFIVAP